MVQLLHLMAKPSRKQSPVKKFIHTLRQRWWLVAAGIVALGVVLFAATFLGGIPLPPGGSSQSTKVLAADGQLIGTLHGEENRSDVPLAQISEHLQKAVVATEDRAFYEHQGVSLKGIIRAVYNNVRGGGVQQGGSTITQQYARNASEVVGRERTILRKIREATLAVKIERKYSKKKILELYLNYVYFGRGAYGAEAAARTYFKKPAKDLDLSQSAYLAGVIRAPQRFQKENNPKGVIKIRDEVLGDMVNSKAIEDSAAEEAKKSDLLAQFKFGASVEQDSPRGAYFIEYVRRLLTSEFKLSESEIYSGGLEIHTTLDLKAQDAAENAVRKNMNKPEDPEVALISMDTQGNIKAMVGGRDVDSVARAREFNYAAGDVRQKFSGRSAGSAFKPFTLATFVDEGLSVKSKFPAPAKVSITSPACRNKDGTPWEPSNFDNASFGTLDVIESTTKSANTVYAQMMDKVTTKRWVPLTEKLLGRPVPKGDIGCALTLGTTPVTPLELARAYTGFAGRGKVPDIISITKIVAPGGKVLEERTPKTTQAMEENIADTVNFALEENIKRGTGTKAKLGRPAAGKTGTTQDHVDALFAGYTPDHIAVVWMGFPAKTDEKTGKQIIPQMTDVRGTRVTGGSFPAVVWKDYMTAALKGVKVTDFVDPKLGGEVLSPSPTPCVSPTPGQDVSNCAPSPTPSPSPSPSPAVVPPSPPGPSPKPKETPTSPPPPPSPSPSPTNT